MNIVLKSKVKANDYGESLTLTNSYLLSYDTDSHGYEYIWSDQGVFRRSVNYWMHSPYGWRRVEPRHLDTWGFQV